MEYAGVHLLDSPYFLDNAFDYYIPSELRNKVAVGNFVSVPFGNANRQKIGLVVSLKEQQDDKSIVCKPISEVCPRISLSDEMLGLCFFMKEQTLCTVGDAVRSMIPASALTRLVEVYYPNPDKTSEDELSAQALLVCEYIRKKGSVSFDLLKKKLGADVKAQLSRLLSDGYIRRDWELRDTAKKVENVISLAIDVGDAQAIVGGTDKKYRLRSQKHIELVRIVLGGEMPERELRRAADASAAQIKALCEKGIIKSFERELDDRQTLPVASGEKKEIILNDEQSEVYSRISDLICSGEPHGALLHGVTGSGKTSVMLRAIDKVLSLGKGAIVLLPEISLTPQSLGIFCARYGERVAVIHSGLSMRQRYEAYMRIKEGRADVVVGTRSAVFAPVKDLGLIVIDEEQEHTYKSDMNPKYHARDIARYRCNHNRALMLLASATPSLQSYKKALDGKYTLLTLGKRYGGARLPEVFVCDMREETRSGNTSPLSTLLCKRLAEVVGKGEQAILFINRRGYNNFVSCRDCGETLKCPRCSVSLTYHTYGNSYDKGELRCHWCGLRQPLPRTCPSCSGEHLVNMGYGTQRIEQELLSFIPSARILRMDADTAVSPDAYDEMLSAFRSHKADILLGTQMVTKGHDFPDVTLVGVLLADASLYMDDYRANERTFAMLTQVIGRAGRGKKAGEAIIQTNNPENECIRLACAQNYEEFFDSAIRLRRVLRFPPYCDIALLTLTSLDEKELFSASKLLAEKMNEYREGEFSSLPLEIYGPFEAPVYKVENRYRMRMVVKCVLNKMTRRLFSALLCEFSGSGAKGISLSIDFNPSNL